MKKVVVIGGGTGSSVILRGLKHIPDIKLTAIVTVADDGGSTGRLRRTYQMPAMGDIRNVMVSLAESENLLGPLMDYRFEGDDDVGGHNLGNLMLTALTQTTGNFTEAIEKLSNVLNIKGTVLPSTTQVVTLIAQMEDGTLVRGESDIPEILNRIERIFYQERVYAYQKSIEAIQEADYIVFGIGSVYTSIIPNLIINELTEAIENSTARKIYFCNAMTQPGETDGYGLEDHVRAIEKHSYEQIFDTVIFNNDEFYEKTLQRYFEKGSVPVYVKEKHHSYKIIERQLLSFEDGLIRHDSERLKQVFEEILNKE